MGVAKKKSFKSVLINLATRLASNIILFINLMTYLIASVCRNSWGLRVDDRLGEYHSLYGEEPSESWWGWKTYNTAFTNNTASK